MKYIKIQIAGQKYKLNPNTRFLIVEDQKNIQIALAKDLRRLGFLGDLFCCAQIADALEALKEQSIDVILLDINLKNGESGIELLKKIKKSKYKQPVIMISALDEVSCLLAAIESGAAEFIVKPWDKNTLMNKLAHSIAV